MYTFAPTSQQRGRHRRCCGRLPRRWCGWVAPILSFTADEVWEYLPPWKAAKLRCIWRCFPSRRKCSPRIRRSCWRSGSRFSRCAIRLCACWKKHGKPSTSARGLEAELEITASGELLALLQRHAAGLKEIVNVSSVRCFGRRRVAGDCAASLGPQVRPLLELHAGSRPITGSGENVCTRCHDALVERGIEPPQPTEAAL